MVANFFVARQDSTTVSAVAQANGARIVYRDSTMEGISQFTVSQRSSKVSVSYDV